MILRVFDDTRGRGTCRSCGAPITWFALVSSGKRHPFDGFEPVYLGTERDAETLRLIAHLDSNESHFVTCPQARDWRRAR